MSVSAKAVRVLLEAAEAEGIARADILGARPTSDAISSTSSWVEWTQLVDMMDRLSRIVDDDPERLRAIGRQIRAVPSYDFFQRAARSIISVEALYRIGVRWVVPAFFPHLPLSIERCGRNRIRFEGSIPEPYAPSRPFFFIAEGAFTTMPSVLGLAPAKILRADHGPRRFELDIELPPLDPLRARVWRAARASLRREEHFELLEGQRRAIVESVEEMRRASDEFRTVLDRFPDPVLIHRDGRVLWVNRALVATLAYEDPSELVGGSLLSLVHPSSDAQARVVMALPIGARSELSTLRLCRRDGEIVVAEVSPPQRIVFGGLEARLVVGRDVSERVRMRDELMMADRLSSLALLAAGVAHEINNPLAYVLGSIENARRSISLSPPDHGQALEALMTALEGVDRVRSIVRDLGVLSRADEQSLESVDVRAVLESTLTLAGPQIEGRARVVREYSPVPEARVNAARLGQVFLNLLVNALESMHDRELAQRELRVRTSTDPTGKPVIEVSDNGAGIAPELMNRIFDPFFTTKLDGHGTGLGLAICYRIVAEAGGDITVDSAPGRGSTFRLTLPPAGGPAAQDA
jgi:PAS domain S-box-containing protein